MRYIALLGEDKPSGERIDNVPVRRFKYRGNARGYLRASLKALERMKNAQARMINWNATHEAQHHLFWSIDPDVVGAKVQDIIEHLKIKLAERV